MQRNAVPMNRDLQGRHYWIEALMKTFDSMKKDFFHVSGEIKTLFNAARELPGISRLAFDE